MVKLAEQFTVGQEIMVWSNRTMVPVHFTIDTVGRKLLHGTFRYAGAQWQGAIKPQRIVGWSE